MEPKLLLYSCNYNPMGESVSAANGLTHLATQLMKSETHRMLTSRKRCEAEKEDKGQELGGEGKHYDSTEASFPRHHSLNSELSEAKE